MNATSAENLSSWEGLMMQRPRTAGRNSAGRPLACHSCSNPVTKKICASFPIVCDVTMSAGEVAMPLRVVIPHRIRDIGNY